MITQEQLKDLFDYNEDTGVFIRKQTSGGVIAGSVAGYLHPKGYVKIAIKGVRYQAHRLAFLYMTGSIPKYVDHINGVRDDNRWKNLRVATASENNYNRKLFNNKLGVKGVDLMRHGKYRAQIIADGTYHYLGLYDTLESASSAVATARETLHKEFARHE